MSPASAFPLMLEGAPSGARMNFVSVFLALGLIGRTSLTDLLRGRERIETELQALIDQRCMPWGVAVESVEMREACNDAAAVSSADAPPGHRRQTGAATRRPYCPTITLK